MGRDQEAIFVLLGTFIVSVFGLLWMVYSTGLYLIPEGVVALEWALIATVLPGIPIIILTLLALTRQTTKKFGAHVGDIWNNY